MSFKCACDVDAETRLSGRRLPVEEKGLLGPKKRLAEFVLELRFFFVDLPKPHPVRGGCPLPPSTRQVTDVGSIGDKPVINQ